MNLIHVKTKFTTDAFNVHRNSNDIAPNTLIFTYFISVLHLHEFKKMNHILKGTCQSIS